MKGAIRFRRGVMRQKRTPKMLEFPSSAVENWLSHDNMNYMDGAA